MSNSLDPDQDQLFVGPDLALNHLQRLAAVKHWNNQQVNYSLYTKLTRC